METEFLAKVNEEMNTSKDSSESSLCPRALTYVEQNAIYYTAGFVVRKLLRKYSGNKNQKEVECTRTLKEMASKVSKSPTADTSTASMPSISSSNCQASASNSQTWISLVDRGGLYHITDTVFNLFVAIELKADAELSSIFQSCGKGIEKVKKESLLWLYDDEEIKSVWSQISDSTIEEDSYREELLCEICFSWITTRGHSKAQQVKEQHKKSKGKGTKGRKSLRKELAPQPREKD